MKRSSLLGIMLVAVTLSACQSNSSTPKTATAEVITFAQCLTQKGAVFYGTERCPHCKQQKALFSSAMSEIKFVDCDQNKLACKAAGVTGYPTRAIPNAMPTTTQTGGLSGSEQTFTNLAGLQTFEELSAATSCPVPANR